MMTLINRIFNPLILWSFGWKRKREPYAGTHRILWKQPKTGYWFVEDAAIIICERGIKIK